MIVRAQCTFQGLSGLPEDIYVNDLYFSTGAGDPTSGDFDAFTAAWANFFNDGAHKVADYLSDQIDRTAGSAKIAFYEAGVPGSPLDVRSWALASIGDVVSLPHELACVVSYHADLTDVPETAANPFPPPAIIRPAARLRGRFYLGPLNEGTLGTEDGDVRLNDTFVGVVIDAATELLSMMDTGTFNIPWVQWSRTAGEANAVVGGYVDNAFDIQRRRGSAPSTRTAFS